MAIELAQAGLNVVALERGEGADTVPTWAYPKVVDEIAQSARRGLLQNLAQTTVTIRHGKGQRAAPYRQIGSFKPGVGVGGAGIHWSGVHSRVMPQELRLKSHVTERYGASFIPDDMNLQDWGLSYDELEPHFDHFEHVCGTSAQAGTQLEAGSPINLRGNDGDGLGRWSANDLYDLLKSGRSILTAVNGQMGEVVQHSTQYMSEADIRAIVTYVKDLGPAPETGRASFAADDATYKTIMAGAEGSGGARMYMDSCAACHRLSGSGENWAFPRLAGNSTVLSEDKSSLIAMILGGGRLPSTAGAPTGLGMPPFGWRYDDEQVAQLATFVRTSWGNHASAVDADQVSAVRKRLRTDNPIKPVPKG